MRFFDYLQWPPPIQFRWLKTIDYWPPPPPDMSRMQSLCLGVTCRTIGDAAMLTTLPGKLKARYPQLRITTHPRAFNPHIFKHNPFLDGISYLPNQVFGDAVSAGFGHHIQLKEQFFDLEVSSNPRPELYLSPKEQNEARYLRKASRLPVCVIHPWGQTRSGQPMQKLWEDLIRSHSQKLSFWQIGVKGERALAGCEQHFLLPRLYGSLRKMMTIISAADFFLGLDSGPMHLARAFEKPSLILLDHCDAAEVFERRKNYPYYIRNNHVDAYIYSANTHLSLGPEPRGNLERASQLLSSVCRLT